MKSRQPKYSEHEKQIIIDAIGTYPTNLNIAFEQAASRLSRRTADGIRGYYYNHLKKDNVPMFAIATRQGAMINTKITTRPKDKRPKLSAFEVAMMATEDMNQDEMKSLIMHMLKKHNNK